MKSALPTLSAIEGVILELLSSDELIGLQIVERSNGRVKRGSVYVTLGRMGQKGYVESRTEPLSTGAAGLPRRYYRPTAFGRRVLDASTLAALAFADRMAQDR